MKHLRPTRRAEIVRQHLEYLMRDWLCRYGDWNRAKLRAELARQAKEVGK